MIRRHLRLATVFLFFGVLSVGRILAAEFRGQVLDRDSKQPVAGVVVQEFSILGLGPNGRRVVCSGYTNAKGQFRLPIPNQLDPRDLSLIVTRKADSVSETMLNGRGLLMTNIKGLIGVIGNPSVKGNNVIYANLSGHKRRKSSELRH